MRQFFTTVLTTLFSLFFAFNALADTNPKQEMRAVWMATVWRLDWPSTAGTSSSVQNTQKNELTGYLDRLQKDGFNAVFFQVRTMCDAFYSSSYEPWSSYVSGKRGTSPGWDPLAFCVEECHKRNMECHAWVNPYRYSTGTVWSTSNDNQMNNNGWLITYNNVTIMNPGMAAPRWRIVNVCKEIVNNYDIDGLVFDDYFYPNGIPENSTAPDWSTYTTSGSSLSIGDWRRSNVNLLVKNVYDMIRGSNRPWVRFGISPAGAACSDPEVAKKHGVEPLSNYCSASDWQYNDIYSDPVQWLEDRTIDYISPQLYWKTNHSTNPFGPMTEWWSIVANKFGRHHFASHSISLFYNKSNGDASGNNTTNYQDIGAQLQYSRDYTQNGAPGSVYYSAAYMTGKYVSGFAEWLASNKYQYKSLPPAMTWYSASDPGTISSLTKSGSTLTCTSLGSNVRYVFYAVPTSVNRRQATSDQGGLKAEYIVDMSYTNSVSISGKTSGYWYAVAPLDRYGNEWTLTTLNETINEYTEKANPISPVNGAKFVPKTISLIFKKVNVDSYKIVVAKDANFSNVVFSKTVTPTATADGNYEYDFDGTSLTDGTYYWKVMTSKTSYLETSSDVANFVISTVSEPCAAVELVSPVSGEEFTLENIVMEFKPTDADKYVLHVAMDEGFTYRTFDSSKDPLVKDNGNLYFTGPISVFPDGTFYWKIETSKVGYYNNTSAVGKFVVNRPTWTAPALISPTKGTEVKEDNFTFVAQNVNADSYKLEVSLYSDFSSVLYESTNYTVSGSQVKFTANNIGVVNTKTHYWRVTAIKNGGYHDGVSAVSNFKVVLPCAPVSTIFYPENGFEFNDADVVICATNPANANSCTLQIATDEGFSNIVYSTNSYSLVDDAGAPQYIVPIEDMKSGTYYFRMVTTATGLDDGYSEVRYFTVTNSTYIEGLVTDTDYQLIRSGSGYFKLTNLWIKSQNRGNDLVPTGNTTQCHRDFDVRDIKADGSGYVLVTYCNNSNKADCKLLKYDALTGNYIQDMNIEFSSSYKSSCKTWLPYLNNISVDAGGNVLISNLADTGKQLNIGLYNTATGKESEFHYWTPSSERIDHSYVYGNINGTAYIFTPVSKASKVHRLTFNNGRLSKDESMTVNSLGDAPRMFIVDANHFFLDGTNGYPEYYTWGNSTPSGTFNDADESLQPNAAGNNGMGYVELGYDKFLIYCHEGYGTKQNPKPVKFRIAKGDNLPSSFSGLTEMWTFPEGGLGEIEPYPGGDKGTIVRVARISSNLAYIYVFAPNNGLAAYKMEYVAVTGVDPVFTDDYKPEFVGGELSFGFAVDNIAVYNSAGVLVANEQDVTNCTLPEASGIYIVVARKGDEVKTFKFVR